MRLGLKTENDFFLKLNDINQNIQDAFLKKIINATKTVNLNVMLGDSTVKEISTFDPKNIEILFERVVSGLQEWNTQGISYSYNDDIRRIFVKFQIRELNFSLSLHISVQFHVLLYYKTENKVLDLQKELSEIIDKTNVSDGKYIEDGNKIILEKLEEMGYNNVNEENLFELFYNDEKLSKMLSNKIENNQENNIVELNRRKDILLKELDGLLLEVFQTSDVLIDEQRLVNGEEGCLCNIDIEHIENGSKHGLFDLNLITDELQENISKRLNQILTILDTQD